MKICKKIFLELKLNEIGKKYRKKFRNKKERKKLKIDNFSIISNNCIGGVIYNDLGKKFLSPTVNLYIKPTDFIKFLENMEYYLSLEIKPCKTPLKYPVRSFRGYILIF